MAENSKIEWTDHTAMTYAPMTKDERRQQAATAIALSERVRKKLGAKLHDWTDSQLRRDLGNDEYGAAMRLREGARGKNAN